MSARDYARMKAWEEKRRLNLPESVPPLPPYTAPPTPKTNPPSPLGRKSTDRIVRDGDTVTVQQPRENTTPLKHYTAHRDRSPGQPEGFPHFYVIGDDGQPVRFNHTRGLTKVLPDTTSEVDAMAELGADQIEREQYEEGR